MCHINWEICQYWASVLGGSWHKFKVPPTAAFRWRTKISMVSFSTPGCSVSYSRDFGGPAVEMVSFDQNLQILKLAMETVQKYSKIILLTLSHMAHGIIPESESSHTKVLNQSKVLFTAFFSFLLNGRTGLRHPAVCLKDLWGIRRGVSLLQYFRSKTKQVWLKKNLSYVIVLRTCHEVTT